MNIEKLAKTISGAESGNRKRKTRGLYKKLHEEPYHRAPRRNVPRREKKNIRISLLVKNVETMPKMKRKKKIQLWKRDGKGETKPAPAFAREKKKKGTPQKREKRGLRSQPKRKKGRLRCEGCAKDFLARESEIVAASVKARKVRAGIT